MNTTKSHYSKKLIQPTCEILKKVSNHDIKWDVGKFVEWYILSLSLSIYIYMVQNFNLEYLFLDSLPKKKKKKTISIIGIDLVTLNTYNSKEENKI